MQGNGELELTGGPGLPSKPEAPWTDREGLTKQKARRNGGEEGKEEVSEAVTQDKHKPTIKQQNLDLKDR